MSAIFDFSSVLMIFLMLICTCTYLREMRPTIFDGGKVRLIQTKQNRTEQNKTKQTAFVLCVRCLVSACVFCRFVSFRQHYHNLEEDDYDNARDAARDSISD
jgi:hypothetical protein